MIKAEIGDWGLEIHTFIQFPNLQYLISNPFAPMPFFRKGKSIDGLWLTDEQQSVLAAIFNGAALRSHRDLEGNKHYALYALDGDERRIGRKTVLDLRNKRLLETNHKFPSATFLLTSRGNAVAAQLSSGDGTNPLTARDFIRPN